MQDIFDPRKGVPPMVSGFSRSLKERSPSPPRQWASRGPGWPC